MKVEEFADLAFSANSMPLFGYGCAVFMQSDIVNFQRQGWRAEEILAGLAAVLPKNVFLYVASIPNLAALGSRFVLQGGTQNNLAVVKAEVDFIRTSFRAAGKQPEIIVHEHCGESGAIGAGAEALRLWKNGTRTTFIGLDAVRKIEYRQTRNEDTRCNFCKNNCLRTFIDIKLDDGTHKHIHEIEGKEEEVETACGTNAHGHGHGHAPTDHAHASDTKVDVSLESLIPMAAAPVNAAKKKASKVPLAGNERRLIIATCEKGTVEDVDDMKDIKAGLDQIKEANPNFVDIAAHEVFRPQNAKSVADPIPSRAWTKAAKERIELMQARPKLRVGIPRVLNTYSYAPLFNAYFESLGLQPENVVYSDYTTPEMYRAGANRGAIDPCFPAKIGIPHVHNLIQVKHREKAARRDLLPDVRRADVAARQADGHERVPDGDRDAGNRKGRIYKGK